MKKVWKWIIGIVIVLFIVAAVAAVPLVMHRTVLATFRPGNLPAPRSWNVPNAPRLQPKDGRGLDDWRGNPMMPGQRGLPRFAGRMPFGMFGMGFMFIGMFFRWIIPLALLGLLLFGVYQLGKRSGARSALPPAPVSTPADADSGNQPVG